MTKYRVEFNNCIVFADSEEEAVETAMDEVKQGCSSDFVFQVNEVVDK